MNTPLTILTQSSMSTFRRCPRQFKYRYELGLVRERSSQPLRFGSAFHLGLEVYGTTADAAISIDKAAASYDVIPAWADPFDWAVERETLRSLLAGYFWWYGNDAIEVVNTEGAWHLPLVNPETNGASRTFQLAGKIDKIVRLPDGRLAVLEYKTTGEDISDESDYWLRLRADAQISAYVYAARAKGYDVQTVLYDVTRKPEIAPRLVPELDADGLKIVVAANGERVFNDKGKPRLSADKEKGWTVKSGRETPEQFGTRLLADIGERPQFYFARREIPRLESDLAEFADEVWQQSQQIAYTRKRGNWFRNVSMMTCRSCSYAGPCLGGVPTDQVPAGFVRLDDVHPELAGAEGI